MIRRQPTPTLFPYTTLFRSSRNSRRERRKRNSGQWAVVSGQWIAVSGQWTVGRRHSIRLVASNSRLSTDQDRKSTRLNSSHTVISYAVFCLKKKKKRQNINKMLKKKELDKEWSEREK